MYWNSTAGTMDHIRTAFSTGDKPFSRASFERPHILSFDSGTIINPDIEILKLRLIITNRT